MHIQVNGKHIDVGESLSAHVEEQLTAAVSKYFDRPSMRWLNFAVNALGAIVLGTLACQSFDYALKSYGYGDVSNMMRIPKFPFQFAVALSAALFTVVLILHALKALRPGTIDPSEDA